MCICIPCISVAYTPSWVIPCSHIFTKNRILHDGMIISAMQVAVLLPLYAPITQAVGHWMFGVAAETNPPDPPHVPQTQRHKGLIKALLRETNG